MTLKLPRDSTNLQSAALGRGRRLVTGVKGLYAKPSSAFGTTIFVIFVLLAIIGPIIAPYGENQIIATEARQPPSAYHWFGTDNLGRDIFSRVMLGARDILALSGLGTLLAVITGIFFGLISGYLGGWLDEVIMRFFDSLLALPALLMALVLLGILGPSNNSVLIVVAVVYTPIVARVVRSVALGVKTKGFVEVARLQGESLTWILTREILPSVIPALTVETAIRFSYAIFLVASLGFWVLVFNLPTPIGD